VKALVAAHAAAEQFLVGYRGKKRYVKLLTADFSVTHGTGTLIGWNWLLSHPISRPTSVTNAPLSHIVKKYASDGIEYAP
jgi:hypothetical protein